MAVIHEVVGVAALAALGIVGLAGVEVSAADYNCQSKTCTYSAWCPGDFYETTGKCQIQCFSKCGDGGQICPGQTAGCGS